MRRAHDAGEASIAPNALLHCGNFAILHQMNWVLMISKAAHSSSQRSFIGLTTLLLPVVSQDQEPDAPPPASGSFLFRIIFSQTFVKLTPSLASDYLEARGKRMSVAWRDDA
jgi:hypothetical protein